jgi:hypothetical protein
MMISRSCRTILGGNDNDDRLLVRKNYAVPQRVPTAGQEEPV